MIFEYLIYSDDYKGEILSFSKKLSANFKTYIRESHELVYHKFFMLCVKLIYAHKSPKNYVFGQKICVEDGLLEGNFAQIPRSFTGILIIPMARYITRGSFKIPLGLGGFRENSRSKNSNLVHISFNIITSLLNKFEEDWLPHLSK